MANEKNYVRCNNCMTVFDESEILYKDNDMDEEYCPCCKEKGYIQDVSSLSYVNKCIVLNDMLDLWYEEDYIPSFYGDVRSVLKQSVFVAMVTEWKSAVQVYTDSFFDVDENCIDTEGWIDVDKWIAFFTQHTLKECADKLYWSDCDLYSLDPFGFGGFEAKLLSLDSVIDMFNKGGKL